jgi:hypothetical protein
VLHNCGRSWTTSDSLLRNFHKRSVLDRSHHREVCLQVLLLYLSMRHIEGNCVGYFSEPSESASRRRIRTRCISHLSLFRGFLLNLDIQLCRHVSSMRPTRLSARIAILYMNEIHPLTIQFRRSTKRRRPRRSVFGPQTPNHGRLRIRWLLHLETVCYRPFV